MTVLTMQRKLPKDLEDRWWFSVVYEATYDEPNVVVRNVQPRDQRYRTKEGKIKRCWECTEFKRISDEAESYARWQLRKYVGTLPHRQFVDFIDHADLSPSRTPTMGTIGAPGLNPGHMPAFAFEYNGESCEQIAYVTPQCDREDAILLLRWLEWQYQLKSDVDGKMPLKWEEAVPKLAELVPETLELTDQLWIKKFVNLWG